MAATEAHKKKVKTAKAPEDTKPREPKADAIQFGYPIETDRIKVEFNGTKVTYTLKSTGEVLTKEYDNAHALMIIHGRISRDPHGTYTQQCVAKAKIAMLKLMPIV
jgi:hypothetical protein